MADNTKPKDSVLWTILLERPFLLVWTDCVDLLLTQTLLDKTVGGGGDKRKHLLHIDYTWWVFIFVLQRWRGCKRQVEKKFGKEVMCDYSSKQGDVNGDVVRSSCQCSKS